MTHALRHLFLVAALGALGGTAGCYRGPPADPNPAAPGFDVAGSDERAIEVADRLMQSLGGRARWDATRLIGWNFFGQRRLLWDKHEQTARIEYLGEGPALDVALHLDTRTGRAWRDGVEIVDPAQLQGVLEAAYRHWSNDSYWLVMPYKLKDSGVTLRDLGQRKLGARTMDVLELTLRDAGATPQNRYEVLVSEDRCLVESWSFAEKAGETAPRVTTVWQDWRFYGGIQLSGDRGERKLSDIFVLTEPPSGMLTAPRGT
jgi:hypothetical protein